MTDYGALRGLRVRGRGAARVVIADVGAGSAEEATQRAVAAMAARGLDMAHIETTGGLRLKVGIAGLRLYSVSFRSGGKTAIAFGNRP